MIICMFYQPLASPVAPGGYATLGRPVSLPVSKATHHRSSSDPDLPGSNPGSPDAEVASLLGNPEFTLIVVCSMQVFDFR